MPHSYQNKKIEEENEKDWTRKREARWSRAWRKIRKEKKRKETKRNEKKRKETKRNEKKRKGKRW